MNAEAPEARNAAGWLAGFLSTSSLVAIRSSNYNDFDLAQADWDLAADELITIVSFVSVLATSDGKCEERQSTAIARMTTSRLVLHEFLCSHDLGIEFLKS
ncbi:hypothetical protein BCON_0311g00060 [Botryotinia convoluta]|uniref:Uncharacterized protein n=1 Tax=Botryotinia convoluta TaxID=54673 RepID=A0A4Z1HCV1_9HELO|nr:hypothetical protein BCON_0311g00060 [Botryotinia convoluta]